jgi:hypothetical protein
MFTPQDVIDAYRTKGLKPKFSAFGVTVNLAGVFETYPDRCVCALGALSVGRASDGAWNVIEWAEARNQEFHAWAFADGFDGIPCMYTGDTVEASYELGRQCRLAVLEAFPDTLVNPPAGAIP